MTTIDPVPSNIHLFVYVKHKSQIYAKFHVIIKGYVIGR